MPTAACQVQDPSAIPALPAPVATAAATPASDFAQSLAALLPACYPPLRRLFRCYHVRTQDTEDIVQSALVVLLHQRSLIRDPAAYFFVTVRRLASRDLRRRAEERLVELAEADVRHLASQSPATHRDRCRDARRLLVRLPPPIRQIALLHYGAGLSHREIAARLGQSEAAVRQLLSRGLRRMRGALHP
jgi:RNA polymerase sigma factor (sigma-70 family)